MKQRNEEALQRYQEDHMDEVEIISLHKRYNKTAVKATTKADIKRGGKGVAKTCAKAIAKAPISGYHLFLREQLGKITEEERKKYHSIVSRR